MKKLIISASLAIILPLGSAFAAGMDDVTMQVVDTNDAKDVMNKVEIPDTDKQEATESKHDKKDSAKESVEAAEEASHESAEEAKESANEAKEDAKEDAKESTESTSTAQ